MEREMRRQGLVLLIPPPVPCVYFPVLSNTVGEGPLRAEYQILRVVGLP